MEQTPLKDLIIRQGEHRSYGEKTTEEPHITEDFTHKTFI